MYKPKLKKHHKKGCESSETSSCDCGTTDESSSTNTSCACDSSSSSSSTVVCRRGRRGPPGPPGPAGEIGPQGPPGPGSTGTKLYCFPVCCKGVVIEECYPVDEGEFEDGVLILSKESCLIYHYTAAEDPLEPGQFTLVPQVCPFFFDGCDLYQIECGRCSIVTANEGDAAFFHCCGQVDLYYYSKDPESPDPEKLCWRLCANISQQEKYTQRGNTEIVDTLASGDAVPFSSESANISYFNYDDVEHTIEIPANGDYIITWSVTYQIPEGSTGPVVFELFNVSSNQSIDLSRVAENPPPSNDTYYTLSGTAIAQGLLEGNLIQLRYLGDDNIVLPALDGAVNSNVVIRRIYDRSGSGCIVPPA